LRSLAWQKSPLNESLWFGRFEVLGLLGRGSQAVSLDVIDWQTAQAAVAKVFELAGARDWKQLELAKREAEAVRSVDHARLPQFIHTWSDGDDAVRILFTRKIAGEPLSAFFSRSERRRRQMLAPLMRDLLSALAALHASETVMVHRDVKPDNVIVRVSVQDELEFHLIDFGVVGFPSKATQSTLGSGTLGFMAPEQMYGAFDQRSDLFALGMTATCLLAGQEPHALPRRGIEVDVASAAPGLQRSLVDVLQKMVKHDPAARFATAREVARALDAAR
jgi:serine/threonine protein kinase